MGATPGADQGTFGLFQFSHYLVDLFHVSFYRRFVRRHGNTFRIFKLIYFLVLYINGEINQHRSLPSCAGNVESFLHNMRNILRVADDVTVFYKRLTGAGNVSFLEHIAAHETAVYLAGDDNQRNTVRISRGNTGDHIRGAGAAGHRNYADPARKARITAGRMGRMLFVPNQHRLNIGVQDTVIKRTDSHPRISKYELRVFHFQTLYNCVRSVHVFPSL